MPTVRCLDGFPRKPVKLTSGWPKHKCTQCQVAARLGAARCVGCLLYLADCKCEDHLMQPELSARGERLLALLRAPTPVAGSLTAPTPVEGSPLAESVNRSSDVS